MTELLQFDQSLFYLINTVWTSDWLDLVMPYWRNKYFWTPFYIFLISFLWINYNKKGLFLVLFAILTIAVADTMSSQVIKKTVRRIRPCNDPLMNGFVEVKIACGGGYSFTSSHATNHFALAFFLIFTIGKRFRLFKWLLFFWAFSVAYGQVYVGVHYPFDVIVGALLGISIGTVTSVFYGSFKDLQFDI
ncbi:MAG: phosphatase PAP2 family protein [Bacteroidota bacterium]